MVSVPTLRQLAMSSAYPIRYRIGDRWFGTWRNTMTEASECAASLKEFADEVEIDPLLMAVFLIPNGEIPTPQK